MISVCNISLILCLSQPGRFLATYILKATMAHLLLNYDIKPSPQGRPSDMLFQYNNGPNMRSSYGSAHLWRSLTLTDHILSRFMIRRRKLA